MASNEYGPRVSITGKIAKSIQTKMKNQTFIKFKLAMLALAFAAIAPTAFAQIFITNSDGSDGALVVTSNTVINLGNAITGSWTNSNTATNAGKGIYDPTQWA